MPISRLFQTAASAEEAAQKLRQSGFEHVELLSGSGGDATALQRRGITHDQATRLAERLAAGAALVIVDAPFGTGVAATEILDEAGPSDAVADAGEDTLAYHHRPTHDNAAPLSSALGLPVLSGSAAPLSRLLGLATLTRRQSPGPKSLGLPTLSDNPAPLSSALHVGTLAGKAAPLSSSIKLPLLSRKAAPLSSAIKMNVLASNPAPLSTAAGWKTLSKEAAPLSRLLGLPVLSGDKTHLS